MVRKIRGLDFGRGKRFFSSSDQLGAFHWYQGSFWWEGGREKWLGHAIIARPETTFISRF